MDRLAAPSLSLHRLCSRCFVTQQSHNHITAINRSFKNIIYFTRALRDVNCIQQRFYGLHSRSRSRTTSISRPFSGSLQASLSPKSQPSSCLSGLLVSALANQPCLRQMSSERQKFTTQSKKIPLWQRLLFVSVIGGVAYYLFRDAIHEKEIDSEQTRYQELGKAQLGGDWTLTDHHGNRRSSSEFLGQWVLLYFGFTHCPDICPEELEKLIEIVNRFGKDPTRPNIQPLFISVDPERDSSKVIKEYCAEYSPHLIGFTGSEDEIREVSKKFRVYYGKGERDENNDYIVDHTIIIYLLNPRGEFVNYFGRTLNADNVYTAVAQHIARYEELEQKGKLAK